MAVLQFSRRAVADLREIGLYTFRAWGADQADRYIEEIEKCCTLIAGNPSLGRPCDEVRTRLRRMEHSRHVIFYREKDGTVRISRILHQRMLPSRQPMEDVEL